MGFSKEMKFSEKETDLILLGSDRPLTIDLDRLRRALADPEIGGDLSRMGIASLPDLLSRLNALPAVEIGSPDEALITTVLLKHFADRQLDIDPKVLTYLSLHVERSLASAAAAVAAVDRAALATGRKISRQLVSEVLAGGGLSD